MDGGTIWNVNINSAVTQCLRKVDSLDKITIDIMITDSVAAKSIKEVGGTYSNYQRAKDIREAATGVNAVQEQMKAYPNVHFRYFFQQTVRLDGTAELDFSNKTTWAMQEQGRKDAMKALQEHGEWINPKYEQPKSIAHRLLSWFM